MKFCNIIIFALATIVVSTFGAAKQGKDSSFVYPATTGTPFNYSKITDLIVFGDSYSTSTTDYNTMTYSGFNYSGGKNWELHLADDVHKMKLWNYACGGAVVDLTVVNGNAQYTPMTEQYKYFVNNMSAGKKFSSWKGESTLFAVWFGINDLGGKNRWSGLTSSQIDENIMKSMFKMVEGMYTHGGRNFIFFYVPPVEKSPYYVNNGNANVIGADIPNYNQALKKYAKAFSEAHSDATVFVYDAYSEFTYIMENKSQYGITILNAYCQNLSNWQWSGCQEPKNYFWADAIHPLYEVHKVLATDLDALFTANSKAVITTTTTTTVKKTTTTTTIKPTSTSTACWATALGYNCCKENKVVYTDASGQWGVENNAWCGIIAEPGSCWSKPLGYPCCGSKCPEVYYTDENGSWGVENGDWCGVYVAIKC